MANFIEETGTKKDKVESVTVGESLSVFGRKQGSALLATDNQSLKSIDVGITTLDITSSFFAQKVLPESWFRLFANGGSHFIEANKILYHMDHGKDPEGSMDKPEDSNGPLGLNSGSVKENRSEFIDVKDDSAAVAAINRLNPFAPTAAYANELPPAGNSGNADYSGSPAAGFVALAEAGGAASAFLSEIGRAHV